MTQSAWAGDREGPEGWTYAVLLVRGGDLPEALARMRFSGWVAAPDERAWEVAVAAAPGGTVAAGRRGVVDAGAELGVAGSATVLAAQVVRDRQLLLVAWQDGQELGRYVSDPSAGRDDDTLPDPMGAEHAAAFAAACGLPEHAEELEEVLAEELDAESVIESERLARVLGLLGLPTWPVAAASLPRDVPAGPRARELTRLHAGRPGLAARLAALPAEWWRRRRPPPDPLPEAPRGGLPPEAWDLM